VEMAGIELTL